MDHESVSALDQMWFRGAQYRAAGRVMTLTNPLLVLTREIFQQLLYRIGKELIPDHRFDIHQRSSYSCTLIDRSCFDSKESTRVDHLARNLKLSSLHSNRKRDHSGASNSIVVPTMLILFE